MKKFFAASILVFCAAISLLCLVALLIPGTARAESFPGWYVVNGNKYRCEKPQIKELKTPETLHRYLSENYGYTIIKREDPFSVIVATPDLRHHYIFFYGGDYCNFRLNRVRSN